MKYLVIQEMKEPVEENWAKALEIEKKRTRRREKGERTSGKMITQMFFTLEIPVKGYWVVDCEPEQIVEWINDYKAFMNAKIIPVLTREEWGKI
jgi:hypothetical protein